MYTCMKCSSEKRDCLFLPCGHVTLCWECSSGATVCQICNGNITERTKASICTVQCGVFQLDDFTVIKALNVQCHVIQLDLC